MAALFFITHPEVQIDSQVPVTDWSLSAHGRARMAHFSQSGMLAQVTTIISSTEVKARESAEILAAALPMARLREDAELGENDRSATGFLPPTEFEATADAFFAQPDQSIRGWETARDAQARVRRAVMRAVDSHDGPGDLAIVAHGAVGALMLCYLQGREISRDADQPSQGHYWQARLPDLSLLHGWKAI